MRVTGINQTNIKRLAQLPTVHAAVGKGAGTIAGLVEANAPHRSGHYAGSVEARPMGYKWARARVYVHDFKAWWVEYGAGPSPVRGWRTFPAHHTMRRAVNMSGLRFEDKNRGDY